MKIALQQVSKSFRKNIVLENIQLELGSGEIFCLIGKNGVGKSTLIELVLTMSRPDSGVILVDGQPVTGREEALKRRTGVSLNNGSLVEGLTLKEYLYLLATIYGMNKTTTAERVDRLTGFFFTGGEDLRKPIRYYSSGMKKKASLCAALIHNPELILLDEPFTFLDPAACSNLCDLLLALKQAGKTILVSAHDLLYIDRIATHIGVLNDKAFVFRDRYAVFKAQDDFFNENKLLREILAYDTVDAREMVDALAQA